MLRLTGTRKLQVVLGGAATASRLTVSYMDWSAAGTTGGTQLAQTNGATPVDICDAPGGSVIRDIDHIKLVAKAAMTATFSVNDGSAEEWDTVTLASGDVFEWAPSGATVKNSAGSRRVVFGDITGNLAVGGTLAVTGDTTLTGDLAVNGGDLTTTASTFNLLAANATTINAFGAASVALNIGNASAAAAFPGGVSIPTGKSVAIAGTGTLSVGGTLTYGGVTLTNAVTGTGKMVLDTSPTISGATFTGSATLFTNTTESTSPTTGAVRFSGGVGIAKRLYIGGNLSGSQHVTVEGTYQIYAFGVGNIDAINTEYITMYNSAGQSYLESGKAGAGTARPLNIQVGYGNTIGTFSTTGLSVTGTLTTTQGITSGSVGGTLGSLALKGTTSGTATFTTDATVTKVTLDKPFDIGANALTAGAISGTSGVLQTDSDGTVNTLSLRNASTGTAAINRFRMGNNNGVLDFTIDLFGGNHATLPHIVNILNQYNADLNLGGWGTTRLALTNTGASVTGTLGVTGNVTLSAGALILTATATPTGAGAGVVGQIAWDTSYLYICTATNDWRRVAITDF